MSNYSYAKQLNISFDKAIERTVNALAKQGFGILTEVDVKKTLKKKLDIDFKNYCILGACSPTRAYKALQAEEEIGLMLPCNFIVYEKEGGVTVSAILPTKAFSVVNNKNLELLVKEVEGIFKKIIDSL